MNEDNLAAHSPRRTGIPLLTEMPWGSHICVFYETEEDLADTAASYLRAGLESNEASVWVVSPPISQEHARQLLSRSVPNIDSKMAAGQIEILQGYDWYLNGDQFDPKRITERWSDKLNHALAKGYEGLRVSGNAFWMETQLWNDFCEYEHEVDRAFARQKIVGMCTYSLRESRAEDVLDVARTHHCTLARRNGEWEFLETPELKQAKREIVRLRGALDILSESFAGSDFVTPSERAVLAHLVSGATSKETARALGTPGGQESPLGREPS